MEAQAHKLEIRRLDLSRAADFLAFFDSSAFADNPDWAGCYCVFFHYVGTEAMWQERTAGKNRQLASRLIAQGKLRGYLAYQKGAVVAFCNVNAREAYPLLAKRRLRAAPGNIASLVCFIVAATQRRQGVARRLLDFIEADLAKEGYAVLEAYPDGKAMGASANYHGPLSLYLKAGYSVIAEESGVLTVRKDLAPLPLASPTRTLSSEALGALFVELCGKNGWLSETEPSGTLSLTAEGERALRRLGIDTGRFR